MAKAPGWRIVFLDASTIDCGRISFDRFKSGWDCEFQTMTSPAELPGRIAGRQVAVTNKVVFDAETLARPEAADLKLIAIAATGTNNVDLDAAKARGVAVCNVAGYSTEAVAQQTFAMILELMSHAGRYSREVSEGAWERSPIFTLLTHEIRELAGRTMGIVGYGRIGRAVARVARGFGMQVIVTDQYAAGSGEETFVGLEELLRKADVVSVHCPLTPETRNLIDAKAIGMMKPEAVIVNAARGGIVDEAALIDALRRGRIAGAATDVLTVEPPTADHPMARAARELENLLITPHVAWASFDARRRLLEEIALNIEAFERGGERNRVA